MPDSDSEEEPTIASDVVVTKYKMVGDMVNDVLKQVMVKCVAGAEVVSICDFGDKTLEEMTGGVYKKDKEMKKGIAFPTCISVNNCVCHFSPLRSDKKVELKDGDVVKIDLGAHVDGFIGVVAHTLIVGASSDNKVKGRNADLLRAAHTMAEAALRKVKPDTQNNEVTEMIQKAAESFGCKPVSGMLSHQLKRNIINGEKSIIQNPTEEQLREHSKCTFEVHEVYAIDVLVSTGEGKAKERENRVTVYKRTDETYQLKMRTSRTFFSELTKRFTTMPFSLRSFEDEGKARMGIVECLNHNLVEPYPVLYEKDGEFVAQFKFTVLLMPNGPLKITGLPVDLSLYPSDKSVEDKELKELLNSSVSRKAQKKKKKKAAKQAEAAEDEEAPTLVEEKKPTLVEEEKK
ncbi:proliferation-associated protein 2G4 [Strongylocentrotus purpuratus]|uniref:Peptidase M24 domain-containing protein n=1 Tax=Strongylocentrotus purpuratus TaxID=7668 RepID=A0A7M7R938_STRPU|nr:proliferation-associated protein 2G4 [Strongylocentrotus purpuratus]